MCEQQLKSYFDYVLPLVLQAGQELLTVKHIEAEFKNDNIWDLVTIYDKKIEDILIKQIKSQYPTHRFIGEEESNNKIIKLTDHPTWIIDPIDGTANFVKRIPITCISVGLTINKEQMLGIVYNPYLDELFTAIKNKGAFLNGKRIFTNGEKDLRKSIFCYELSLARRNEYYYNLYMYRLKHLIKHITGIRSFGCGVLSACYVACGKLDAYQVDGLYAWDAAAATLIVKEAGGSVVDTTGKDFDLTDPNFLVAATKELAEQYMEIERRADEECLNDTKANRVFRP